MAMDYYKGSSEPDHTQLQTLHLMNPNCVTFSDTQDNSFMSNPKPSQFVGFTLMSPSTVASLLDHDQQEDHGTRYIPSLYNSSSVWELAAYNDLENQSTSMAVQHVSSQGLSLSLSPHRINTAAFQKSNSINNPIIGQAQKFPGKNIICDFSDLSYPVVQGVVLGPKYLKAAQELLDEVACVGKDTKINDHEVRDRGKDVIVKRSNDHETEDKASGAAAYLELTEAQRQEMQIKKAKLYIMLDEVNQRCRHYHHQMQTTISSFEREAGIGSSSSYTQLALETVLKQFKRLKHAIISQIKSTNKSLRAHEKHIPGEKIEGLRLEFIDSQLRLRSPHPLIGMMQQNSAWRPQRGLPETAVSVLRTWLFEHFLHPYPKNSDKIMLAKQSGLTRSQVSNWFINARVRLWKPMIEEMYLEEMSNQKKDCSSHINTTPFSSDQHHHLRHGQLSSSDYHQVSITQNPITNLAALSPTSSEFSLFKAPSARILPQLKFPADEKINNLKRPRSIICENNHENSLSSSIIQPSVEMEMKDHMIMIRNKEGFRGDGDRDYSNYSDVHRGCNNDQGSGLGNYGLLGEVSRFNTVQIREDYLQGNNYSSNNNEGYNFSLSLALPPPSVSSRHGEFDRQIGFWS